MNIEIRPIETIYKGFRFRSRLEARWAIFFDAMGIKWTYEQEGFMLSDGSMYLPDFYLPDSKTFFEAKGIMSELDEHKIEQFIRDINMPITVGYADMGFDACDNRSGEGYELYERTDSSSSMLCRCCKCGGIYFMGINGLYTCPCCGYWDGDSGFNILAYGNHADGEPWYIIRDAETRKAIEKAKQARFEHGETPT